MTTESTNRSKHALNRLQHATSPYLQQHAHNPVDWFEWGQEAIDKARRENKPIFLSIGYSACHWCHVMAHESFEDPAIANVMNRLFVNVKVDREERPDIDDIYMQATLVYTRGQGGWPMSVWLTPELKPFFAGTYFPPTQRYGRPGFREICERIGDLWAGDRAALESDANRITEHLSGQSTSSQPTLIALTPDVIDRTADLLAGAFDARKGGLLSGGTNKFPPSMALELMMRSAARRNEDDAARRQLMDRVTVTLDRMANGGIHDQLAGGFHRYSTDADWLAPHFEKMLYDQALISRAYVEAYLLTGDSRYARVARGVFEYVLEDLCSPDGAFYSTRDADSEGEEGRYYVWTREQIARALPAAELDAFCDYYGVTEAGNWDDPHTPGAPKNILHVAQPLTDDNEANRFRGARAALLKAREQRIPPHRDEKVLCEWNGLMIASLARGGAALNESRYVHAASRAADSILRRQYRDGRLMRSYRDGRTLDMAFLTDYACMIDGLIELHQATQDARWLETARRLDEVLTAQFWDEGRGGYFSTAANHEALILRPKDFRDGATPSGNSVQLGNLLRLAVLFDDAGCRERATQTIDAFAGELLQAPGACERFLASADMALHGSVEIVIVGDAGDARTHALERTVYEQYLPNRLLLRVNPNNGDISAASPLVAGRKMVDGAPAAYVCRNYACRSPVTTPAALASQLREFGRGR